MKESGESPEVPHQFMTHWTQKDGTKIAVSEMTPEHLVNTIKMLHRQVSRAQIAAAHLCAELIRRGDGDKLRASVGEPVEDDDSLDDCVVGGCDRYGSLQQ